MGDIYLSNQLRVPLIRAQYDKQALTSPPEEIQPNTTLSWHVENAGSVTYDLAPDDGERGVVRRFTLEWPLTPSGEVLCQARDVASSLNIEVTRRPDGVLCAVAPKRRRAPPPARRSPTAPRIPRIAPLVAGVVIAALLGVMAVAHGAQSGGQSGSSARQRASDGQSSGAAANLVVSPSEATTVACSGSSVPFPPITLTNTGGQTLTWSAHATLTGASVNPASGSVAAGASQTLRVTQPGPTKEATYVSISSTAGRANVTFVCGTATSTPHGYLTAAPLSLALGNYCGDSFSFSAGFALTLTNTGNGSLTWSQARGARFALSPASGKLSTGASQPVIVSGTKSDSSFPIHWQDGGKGTVKSLTIHTYCNKSPTPHGNLTVNPTSLALGDYCGGDFSGVSLTLTNTGNGSLTWSQAGGSSFTLTPSSGTLSAGASQTLAVSGTKANSGFQINWLDGGQGNTNTVSVTTICVVQPTPTPTPPYLTWSSIQATINCNNPATLTLGNSGQQTLTWSIDATNGNGATASPASGSIVSGGSVSVKISGGPVDASKDGSLIINSNGGSVTITVSWLYVC